MSLGHYAHVLRVRVWIILLIVFLSSGITLVANLLATPVYDASALIEVHSTSSANSSVFTDQALAQSYALLVNRPDVLQAVAAKIPGTSVRQLENQVSDSPLDNTQIIQVRASAKSANAAATITNTVVDVFIQMEVARETDRLKGVISKANSDLATAKRVMDTDQAQLSSMQTQHAGQDAVARQNDLVSSDQATYSAAQSSYNQAQQQLLQVANTLTVAQRATPPEALTSPRTLVNTLVAAALSLVLMIVLVLILDWMDTTLKTPDDIELLAHMNALGSLPVRKDRDGQKKLSVGMGRSVMQDKVLEQAFVGIGTTLSMLGNGTRSLLVTSLRRQAGTSMVAANLAISLARTGMRVLLIDTNFQHPTLHTFLQRTNARGLTTLLNDSAMQQEANCTQAATWLGQWNSGIPNLWFIPSGPINTQQSVVLRSPVMNTLLKCLLQTTQITESTLFNSPVDVVIFDSAPLEESANTLAVASYADASLLVIEAGKEQVFSVRKAQAVLRRLHAPVIGAVLNRQQPQQQSYFYAQRFQRFDGRREGSKPTSSSGSLTGAVPVVSSFAGRGSRQSASPSRPGFPITPRRSMADDAQGIGQMHSFSFVNGESNMHSNKG